ncbi:hypothetical protein IH779_02825 [Patescibacteria group bacterium]|nr:hypothetical protein [Patescibacteria group bacterium]
MQIFELKRSLANILEIPEDPVRWVGISLLNQEKFLGQRSSPKMLAMLVRAFSLEFVWEEFEEVLKKAGKDLNTELSHEEIEILVDLTKQFFDEVEIARYGRMSSVEIRKDKDVFLEAVSVVKSSL